MEARLGRNKFRINGKILKRQLIDEESKSKNVTSTWTSMITCNSVSEQSLATTRRSVKQNASGGSDADVLVDLRMLEVDQQLANLEKNLLEAAELREGYFRFLDFEVGTFFSS